MLPVDHKMMKAQYNYVAYKLTTTMKIKIIISQYKYKIEITITCFEKPNVCGDHNSLKLNSPGMGV